MSGTVLLAAAAAVAGVSSECPPGYTHHAAGYWANPYPDWHNHPVDTQNDTVSERVSLTRTIKGREMWSEISAVMVQQ